MLFFSPSARNYTDTNTTELVPLPEDPIANSNTSPKVILFSCFQPEHFLSKILAMLVLCLLVELTRVCFMMEFHVFQSFFDFVKHGQAAAFFLEFGLMSMRTMVMALGKLRSVFSLFNEVPGPLCSKKIPRHILPYFGQTNLPAL